MHGGENAIGRGLQRHVEVLSDARCGSEQRDQILGHVERLDRADANTLDRRFVENATQEIVEFHTRRKIAAISAEIDAAENDFAIARFAEASDFCDDFVGRRGCGFFRVQMG